MSPVRICLTRGCSERVLDGSYCEACARERTAARSRARAAAGDPRQTHRWRTVIRPRVLRRDGHRCTRCGSTDNLEVHHIRGLDANRLEDLTTLCKSCNSSLGSPRRGSKTWPPSRS